MRVIPGARLGRASTTTLILLQLLFAACATSVLLYNLFGWAPAVIDFGWGSYRALNIDASLVLVAVIVIALLRQTHWGVPLLAGFALFPGIEGVVIGFWGKAALQLATLAILVWACLRPLPSSRGGE